MELLLTVATFVPASSPNRSKEMSTQNLTAWLSSLLKQKSVSSPDGRSLFAYDLSKDDYIELGRQLAGAVASTGGISELAEICWGRPPIFSPPARSFYTHLNSGRANMQEGHRFFTTVSPLLTAIGPSRKLLHSVASTRWCAIYLNRWRLMPAPSKSVPWTGASSNSGSMRSLFNGAARGRERGQRRQPIPGMASRIRPLGREKNFFRPLCNRGPILFDA